MEPASRDFRASSIMRNLSSQGITSGSTQLILFNEVVVDHDQCIDLNNSQSKIIIVYDGWYLITYRTKWTSLTYVIVEPRLNGTAYYPLTDRNFTTTHEITGSLLLDLVAGDYLELTCFHAAGAGISITNAQFGVTRLR
jgi:hypothetical protein